MAGVRVKIDTSFLGEANTKVTALAKQDYYDHREEIGEAFIEVVTPYVPLRTGELINSGHVVNTSKEEIAVAWNKSKKGFDIAREQYYHPHNHLPGRTDHWDKAAMEYDGELFRQRCEDILNGR